VVEAFFTAARTGNFDALLAVLDPDVVFRHDHMSVPAGVPGEIHGAAATGRVDGMKTRETAILSTTDCEMVSIS
jgi:RNA polymerase sigma-70 factor (ECF subfamily)